MQILTPAHTNCLVLKWRNCKDCGSQTGSMLERSSRSHSIVAPLTHMRSSCLAVIQCTRPSERLCIPLLSLSHHTCSASWSLLQADGALKHHCFDQKPQPGCTVEATHGIHQTGLTVWHAYTLLKTTRHPASKKSSVIVGCDEAAPATTPVKKWGGREDEAS